jgi:hypothetical protein
VARRGSAGVKARASVGSGATSPRLPSKLAKVTAAKAKKILTHGAVRGHKLTPKQRGLFGALAGGAARKRRAG